MGSGSNTLGDWTEGVTHPIVNESPLSLNLSIWRPYGYPRINVVRPSDREIVLDTRNEASFQAQTDAINAAGIDGIVLGENGSCTYPGCTDPSACNWDEMARL